MGLFEKPVYKEVELPFIFIEDDMELDCAAAAFTIEAYGDIDGQIKYFFVSHMLTDLSLCDSGEYDEMLNELKHAHGKTVRLRLKYKKSRLVDFEVEKESLAACMEDQRFHAIERLVWGINDKPRRGMKDKRDISYG